MPFTLNGDTVEISGTPTINEVFSSGLFSQFQGAVLELTRNVKLMDGADLSKMKGVIFDTNGRNFQPETAGSCPQLSGIGFIYNGQEEGNAGGISNRWVATDLNLKDCTIYARSTKSVFGIEQADNVVITSSYNPSRSGTNTDAGGGIAPFLVRGGLFQGLSIYEPSRLGVSAVDATDDARNRFHLKNITVEISGEFIIGYNSAPDTIWENCTFNGNTSLSVDTYQNDLRDNTMVLLGSSIEAFFNGGNTFPRSQARNNFRCFTGGKRYFNIQNGNGVLFQFFANVNGTVSSQPLRITREASGLLSSTPVVLSSDNETVEFTLLTGIWDPGGTIGASGLINYTDLCLCVIHYNKELSVERMTQAVAEEIRGSTEAPVPWVIQDDASITESSRAAVISYTEIVNPQQFYDRAKEHLTSNFSGQSSLYATREDNTIIIPGRDCVIDASASEAMSITDTTITIRADVFTGNLSLDSNKTLFLSNGAVLEGVYADSTRDSAVELLGVNLAPAANTLEVSDDDGVNWTSLATNVYAYRHSATGSVTFRYTKGDGEDGDPIVYTDDYMLSPGLDNIFTSFTNETGQLINAQTTALQSSLNALQTAIENAQETAAEARDHAHAANVQTQRDE